MCVEPLGAQAACFFAYPQELPLKRELTIVGASVRAAAQSAVRAGFTVHAADLFADQDVRQVCHAEAVADYPAGLSHVVAGPQTGGWMFTGALENSPQLIDRLATIRPLLGNQGSALREVRRADLVEQSLRNTGLLAPEVRMNRAIVGPGWLRKPLRSAGGAQIATCDEPDLGERIEPAEYYCQRFVAGAPCSAAYLTAHGQARLLGVTRQLIGERWTGASGFRYCGSIGPLALENEQFAVFERIGQVLAQRFALVGLFGVDAIVNQLGVWTVEVNPRYTASMELLEASLSTSLIDLHVRACVAGELPADDVAFGPTTAAFGKAIVYAEHAFSLEENWAPLAALRTDGSRLADIPAPGTRFQFGWPVVTVLTSGDDEQQVLAGLRQRVTEVQRLIAAQPRLAVAAR